MKEKHFDNVIDNAEKRQRLGELLGEIHSYENVIRFAKDKISYLENEIATLCRNVSDK